MFFLENFLEAFANLAVAIDTFRCFRLDFRDELFDVKLDRCLTDIIRLAGAVRDDASHHA